MLYPTFIENQLVNYKHMCGEIRFISEFYITICVSKGEHKSKDVCALVPKSNWHLVTPVELAQTP